MKIVGEGALKEFEKETILQDIREIIGRVQEQITDSTHLPLKSRFHDALQQAIVDLAQQYGMFGYPEHEVQDYHEGKRGLIDVAWKGRDGTQFLMEIDSSFRQESVQKLMKAKAPLKLWLYYGDKPIAHLLGESEQQEITLLSVPLHLPKTKKSQMAYLVRF